ncbi:MAG TPA: PH domain-containing protein [Patescibacteria group bacterium]
MDGFSKYHFKDLEENEQIIKVLHRNWFYLFEQFFWILVISIVIFLSVVLGPAYFPNLLGGEFRPTALFLENFFMLAIWIFSFIIWIDYYYDIWIITDQRIINIEQRGLFARKVSEMTFDKMQDISVQVDGFLPTMLNFGDVRVQTAGEIEDFIFRTISDPYHIKNIIVEMHKKDELNSTERLGDMIKEKMGQGSE